MASPISPDPQQKKPLDAGDAESVGLQKREKNAREARRLEAFSRFIRDPGGREWVWDLLSTCYIFHTTFTGNSEGFMREGKRNVGLQILADLMKVNPEAFAQMMRENK